MSSHGNAAVAAARSDKGSDSTSKKDKDKDQNSDMDSGSGEDAVEWEDSRASLREALEANRELRNRVLLELEETARSKRDNRLEAATCTRRLSEAVLAGEARPPLHGEGSRSWPPPTSAGKPSKKRKKNHREDDDYVPTSEEIDRLLAGDALAADRTYEKKADTKRQKWSIYQRKKFRFDPYRKWTLDYFADPVGSRPGENADVLRRKRLMTKRERPVPGREGQEEEGVPDTFFHHTSQPFTPQEMARLDKWLRETNTTSNNNGCGSANGSASDPFFYERIAQKLRDEHHGDPVQRKRDKVLLPTCLPRSAEEIRLYHRDRLASGHAFSKQESLAILESVAAEPGPPSDDGDGVDRSDGKGNGNGDGDHDSGENRSKDPARPERPAAGPDWKAICERVLEVHRASRSGADPGEDGVGPARGGEGDPPITPYRCMVHYKTKLRRRPDGSFTPEEDELLLRYIAAMGPQFVWGNLEIADLASRLFPTKSVRRIYERTHYSQWHPLSKDTIWTKEEEQKLVLAMKVYSEVGSTAIANSDRGGGPGDGGVGDDATPGGNRPESRRVALEKAAVRRAAAHFHPQRQVYKVVKKWERSFSPRYSYRPFSREEDARLLEAVRSSAANTPFSEIARKHFPNRSSDQLGQRWSKIAPDDDVVEQLVPSLIRTGVKRGLVGTAARTTRGRAELFDTNDFVVEVLPGRDKGSFAGGESGRGACNASASAILGATDGETPAR